MEIHHHAEIGLAGEELAGLLVAVKGQFVLYPVELQDLRQDKGIIKSLQIWVTSGGASVGVAPSAHSQSVCFFWLVNCTRYSAIRA